MKLPIYMDYQATTPVDPRVWQAMEPYFTTVFGNAASKSHTFGWQAEAAVKKARQQVADALGGTSEEIFFTSGATESNNLAIFGIAEGLKGQGNHLITTVTEHKAVLDPCAFLEKQGFEITYLPVDSKGKIDLEALQKEIRPKTILISIMAANNEIGTIHPLKEIAKVAQEHEVIFHTDAAQAVGKIPFDLKEVGVDLVSFSAHKFYGPKGVGALYVRRKSPRIPLEPILYGGGHENGLRSGTPNVPGIVGMGAALEICKEKIYKEYKQLNRLRDNLQNLLLESIPKTKINGDLQCRLPHNLNVTFPGVPADRLMMELRDVAISSGSACTSASPKPSHVLKALGLEDEDVRSSIRFGLGRFTTEEEVLYVGKRVIEVVERLLLSG